MPTSSTRRRMASFARELKDSVSTDWRVQGPYQWATVAALHIGGTFGTLDVYLDSTASSPGATLALGIPFLNGYAPTVGDTVLVGRMAGSAKTQRIVLGPLEQVGSGVNQAGEGFFTDVTVSGLTGATAGYRLVGSTPCGPPLTGTFAFMDMVFDRTTFGRWICTVAGSPGTWIADGGAITSPKPPTIVVNTTGTTTYYYAIVAEGTNGSTFYEAIPSQSTKITNGAATPNNTINWTQPVGCAPLTDWIVLVSTDNLTWSRIQFVNNALTFTDTNQTRFAHTPKTANPGGGRVIDSHLYQMRAYQTGTAQGISGVVQPIHFNSVAVSTLGNSIVRAGYDPNGDYDAVTNFTYTVKVAGFYELSAIVMVNQGATAGTNRFRAWIEVNSQEYIEGAEVISGGANSFPASNPNDVVYLYAGDAVRVSCFFNAGAGPVLYNSNAASRFSVKYLGS